MTHEEAAHEAMLEFMELIERIDLSIKIGIDVQAMHLIDVDQQDWSVVQALMVMNENLLSLMKEMLIGGSKIVDNEAVISHIGAVINAD